LGKSVDRYGADRYCKSFTTREHLCVMAYAQLSKLQSLRAIETGFNAQRNHLYHLGAHEARRTTLAKANERRDPRVFADLARLLMAMVGGRQLRKDCADLLYLLDSTSVTLKGQGFDDWAGATRVRSTQGLKLHVLYEAHSGAPHWHSISATNVNDVTEALGAPLVQGATYVFDKGYCDFNWWRDIDLAGARFVTRFKQNVALQVLQTRDVPAEGAILRDEIVRFANPRPGAGRRNHYTQALRRVVVAREGKAPLEFATNDLDSPAEKIAQLYKDRWGVELFFKWIKQNLNIKRFCGRSENAVRIQVLTALITYLLMVIEHALAGRPVTLLRYFDEMKSTLFQRPGVEHALAERRRRHRRELLARQAALFTAS
jgi:IS4 transposase